MRVSSFSAFWAVVIISFLAEAQTPPTVTLVDIIPRAYSGEANQDSEPFLSVNQSNPDVMAISAFTPDPGGPGSSTAPIFVTVDGGKSWTLNSVLPSQGATADISHAITSERRMFASILAVPADTMPLKELFTTDVLSPSLMTVQGHRTQVDQPFVVAKTVGSEERVYVGMNDFNQNSGKTAALDITVDGGSSYKTISLEDRDTSGQDGPSVRPAVAKDGITYVAFLGWRSFTGNLATADVVVARDDNGGKGQNAFHSLVGSDGHLGVVVAPSIKIPWLNEAALGPERIGSTLSLAVDPNDSKRAYVGWGERIGNGDIYSIVLSNSTDGGKTWSKRKQIKNATCIAIAIAENGTVGFLYQQLVTKNGKLRWVTKLEQTRDDFVSTTTTTLADVSAELSQPNLPYNGDYNCLLAVGNEFRGVFSTNNEPIGGNFPPEVKYQRNVDFAHASLLSLENKPVLASIDPFYFSVQVIH